MGNIVVLNEIVAEQRGASANHILDVWAQNVTHHMDVVMAAARSRESVNLLTTTQLSLVARGGNSEPR
eukprot:1570392-Lingulodinium_polyedra.AAC.1